MHYRVLIGVVLLSCAALAFWLVRERLGGQEQTTFLHWQEPRIVAEGAALYRTHCASCHAIADASMPAVPPEEQDTPPHDASGHTWQHPDYALFQLVRDGVAVANCTPVDPERMPSFRDTVSDTELVAILSYIKSTWPEDIRREHDKVNFMYGPYNAAVGELIGATAAE